VTAGPALVAAATPVNTKTPAPMIAPIPRRIKSNEPNTLLRSDDCCACFIFFLRRVFSCFSIPYET